MVRWVEQAKKFVGLKEIKGPQHAPEILQMWRDIKRSGIKNDETPWCAAFVGSCLERVGITSTRFEGARSYESWGVALSRPAPGCVVVFSRQGGGHVGFVVGQDPDGNILVLGGNQSDAVNVRAFPRSRVTAYRWPAGEPMPVTDLPVMAPESFSSNEA
ncbi:TIGR02594 family protein [Salmonella enterica]|uniref:TIGR02594 family protein n=1 Tax=Citrobacter freundii TaxID=546 RepID=UPI0013CF6E61|nr:TIGR02594 family protein [Citrobacter freundii]EGN9571876.1 TIGR02594 family protein [Salmonella enterica]